MISLKENINNFLYYISKIRGYAPSSIETYENVLAEMFSVSQFYYENEKYILDITPLRLKIIDNSKKTISKKLSAVRSLVKFMREQKELEVQVLGDSIIKVPKTLPKPLDENIINEILEICNRKEKIIIVLLYGLGLRISELAELKLVNLSETWIRVKGKGDKEREIPLLPELYNEILLYIEQEHPTEFLLEKSGKAMNTQQIRYLFTKVFKKHGIKATPHQLRHSFATHLLHNGARIADVSVLLGHSSMSSTQIYTQLEDSKKLNEYSKAHPLCNLGE